MTKIRKKNKGEGLNIADLLNELETIKTGAAGSTTPAATIEALELFNRREKRKGSTLARLNVSDGVFSLYTGEAEVFWKHASAEVTAMFLIGQDTSHLADDTTPPAADDNAEQRRTSTAVDAELRPSSTKSDQDGSSSNNPPNCEVCGDTGVIVASGSEKGGPINAPCPRCNPSPANGDEIVGKPFGAARYDQLQDYGILIAKIINSFAEHQEVTRLIEIPIGRRPPDQYVSQHVDMKLTKEEAETLADVAAGLRAANVVTPQKGRVPLKPMDVIRYLIGWTAIAVQDARSELNSDE